MSVPKDRKGSAKEMTPMQMKRKIAQMQKGLTHQAMADLVVKMTGDDCGRQLVSLVMMDYARSARVEAALAIILGGENAKPQQFGWRKLAKDPDFKIKVPKARHAKRGTGGKFVARQREVELAA